MSDRANFRPTIPIEDAVGTLIDGLRDIDLAELLGPRDDDDARMRILDSISDGEEDRGAAR